MKPGNYKVKWEGAVPDIQVTFLRDGKTVATAPATLKTNQVTLDGIVTDSENSTLHGSTSVVTKKPWCFSRAVCNPLFKSKDAPLFASILAKGGVLLAETIWITEHLILHSAATPLRDLRSQNP